MRLKPVLNWANVCSPNILRIENSANSKAINNNNNDHHSSSCSSSKVCVCEGGGG